MKISRTSRDGPFALSLTSSVHPLSSSLRFSFLVILFTCTQLLSAHANRWTFQLYITPIPFSAGDHPLLKWVMQTLCLVLYLVRRRHLPTEICHNCHDNRIQHFLNRNIRNPQDDGRNYQNYGYPYFFLAPRSIMLGIIQYRACANRYQPGSHNVLVPLSTASMHFFATYSFFNTFCFLGVTSMLGLSVVIALASTSTAPLRKSPSILAGRTALNVTEGCSMARAWNNTRPADLVAA